MPDDDILTRAEKACEGVTEGPWEVDPGNDFSAYHDIGGPGGLWVAQTKHATPDAAFIAAARTLMPELIAALAAERAETTRLRAAVERVRAVHRRGIYTATGNAFCFACEDEYGRKPWPCPTIAALEAPGGEQ